MTTEYCFRLTSYAPNQDGVPVKDKDILIDPAIITARFSRTERGVGAFSATLANDRIDLCDVKHYDMIEVHRSCRGQPFQHYRTYFVNNIQAGLTEDSGLVLLLQGIDTNAMLEWRQVATDLNRNNAVAASNALGILTNLTREFSDDIVNYELAGGPAVMSIPGRDLLTNYMDISLPGDGFVNWPVTDQVSFNWTDTVLSAMNTIVNAANASGQAYTDGEPLYMTFDMSHNGDGTFTINFRNQQLGQDLRGRLPEICSENGSLADVTATFSGDLLRNFVYGIHTGSGVATEPEDGIVASVGSSQSIGSHYWGLREMANQESQRFDDGTNFGYVTGASILLAQSTLAEQGISDSIVGTVVNTSALCYGCNYEFGDRVNVAFQLGLRECGAIDAEARITGEEITISEEGIQTRVQLQAQATIDQILADVGNPSVL